MTREMQPAEIPAGARGLFADSPDLALDVLRILARSSLPAPAVARARAVLAALEAEAAGASARGDGAGLAGVAPCCDRSPRTPPARHGHAR